MLDHLPAVGRLNATALKGLGFLSQVTDGILTTLISYNGLRSPTQSCIVQQSCRIHIPPISWCDKHVYQHSRVVKLIHLPGQLGAVVPSSTSPDTLVAREALEFTTRSFTGAILQRLPDSVDESAIQVIFRIAKIILEIRDVRHIASQRPTADHGFRVRNTTSIQSSGV